MSAEEWNVMIFVPTRDAAVSAPTAISIWQLARERAVHALEIHVAEQDLVRIRSRAVRMFLETDSTHLLFVDSDVAFVPQAIAGMLRADKDVVATPYPFKRMPLDYPFNLGTAEKSDAKGCIEVDGVPMGCTLLNRATLRMMRDHYAPSLSFDDKGAPTVALFQLVLDKHKGLLSEDYSFCHRWRALGGQVYLYVGPGAPATHTGMHEFVGDRGELVTTP